MLLNPPKRKVGISLTPLIDVVFILLLFFMLTSQFIEWRSLDLSIGGTASSLPIDQERPVRLLVLNDEAGFVCSGSKFETLTHESLNRCGNTLQPVIIDMEPKVTTQAAITTIESLKALGFAQVGMGVVR